MKSKTPSRTSFRPRSASVRSTEISCRSTLHAAQAVDLRRNLKTKDLTLGAKTQAFYEAYRKAVPYVKSDRIFTDDIRRGVEVLETYEP